MPFAKTGGLADVCGALPIELERLGSSFRVCRDFDPSHGGQPVEPLVEFNIPIGSKISKGLAKSFATVRLTFSSFNSPSILNALNCIAKRAKTTRTTANGLFFLPCGHGVDSFSDLQVDVPHGNDWQAGLLAAYLLEYRRIPGFEKIASLLTIHNLAYQGNFALGYGVDRSGLETLQLAANGILRTSEPAEDRFGFC